MSNEDDWAKPGDIIEIIDVSPIMSRYLGKKYLVAEHPKERFNKGPPGSAWVHKDSDPDPNIPSGYFTSESYKVVKRAGGHLLISNTDVDESLKRQLHNNLKHAFGY